jgi:hypothetical protein
MARPRTHAALPWRPAALGPACLLRREFSQQRVMRRTTACHPLLKHPACLHPCPQVSASLAELPQAVRAFEAARLVPYVRGSPAGMVASLDALMGFAAA